MGARLIFSCLLELERVHCTFTKEHAEKVQAARAAAYDTVFSTHKGMMLPASSSSQATAGTAAAAEGSGGGFLRSSFFGGKSSSSSFAWGSSDGSKSGGCGHASDSASATAAATAAAAGVAEAAAAAEEAADAAEASLACDSPVAGLVADAVLMGCPVPVDPATWRKARAAVCGRLVNCHSRHDWTLGVLYRYQRWSTTVAGIRPVVDAPGVENVDVSGAVATHTDYPFKTGEVLDLVRLEDDAKAAAVSHMAACASQGL